MSYSCLSVSCAIHKWRIRDVTKLSVDEQAEYSADVAESNRRYEKAYGTVLDHTSLAEQTAFWKPFSETDDELSESLGELQALSDLGAGTNVEKQPAFECANPMLTEMEAVAQRSNGSGDPAAGDGEAVL